MENNNFKLCGGTLFALLTNEKRNKRKAIGNLKGFSEDALMLDLVKIYNPNTFFDLSSDTFKKDTNKYKCCIVNDSNSFNFTNQELINTFDKEFKINYSQKINQMNELMNHFFEIENEPIINKLVRSILELIKNDSSISNKAKFYITPDGKPTTKVSMLIEDTFNLTSFILGVFHFVIVNKINNELGKETYDAWHSVPGNNQQHTFISNIGSEYKEIKVIVDIENIEDEPVETINEENEKCTEEDVVLEMNPNKDANENKTININYQLGRNNFNNIGSLTFIDKD